MTIITTAEELDALPTNSAWKCACGYHGIKGRSDRYVLASGRRLTRAEVLEDHFPLTVLYNPDQPASATPTREQIAEVLAEHRLRSAAVTLDGGSSHACSCGLEWTANPGDYASWERHHAVALAALYPTCQPSRGAVGEAIALHLARYMDAEEDEGDVADAILALLPGRPEAEVKAEALQDAKAEIAALVASQPSREAVAVEIERHGYEQSRNLGYYRSEVTCDCGLVLWWGEHDGDPSRTEVWYGHLADAIREMLHRKPEESPATIPGFEDLPPLPTIRKEDRNG